MACREFTVHYERTPGQHDFTLQDGTPVTALAFPTWEETEAALRALPPTSGYIVTTELITTPMPIEAIPAHIQLAKQRTELAREISETHPGAIFLLGTPASDESGLHNSLAKITNGAVVGHIDKRGRMIGLEASVFNGRLRPQAALNVGHAALICSDLLAAVVDMRRGGATELLPDGVQSILLSACWAVPQVKGNIFADISPDERFRVPLERYIASLFSVLPQLQEIVVIDRAIEESGIPPLTGRFKRT